VARVVAPGTAREAADVALRWKPGGHRIPSPKVETARVWLARVAATGWREPPAITWD
jgi:hypothetical protein